MVKDGEHIFKLLVEIANGPSVIVDIIVSITPFIGLPATIPDMVFIKDGSKATLSKQDIEFEGIGFTLALSDTSIYGVSS